MRRVGRQQFFSGRVVKNNQTMDGSTNNVDDDGLPFGFDDEAWTQLQGSSSNFVNPFEAREAGNNRPPMGALPTNNEDRESEESSNDDSDVDNSNVDDDEEVDDTVETENNEIATVSGFAQDNFTMVGGYKEDVEVKDATHVTKGDNKTIYPYLLYKYVGDDNNNEFLEENDENQLFVHYNNKYFNVEENNDNTFFFKAPHFSYKSKDIHPDTMFPAHLKIRVVIPKAYDNVKEGTYTIHLKDDNEEEEEEDDDENNILLSEDVTITKKTMHAFELKYEPKDATDFYHVVKSLNNTVSTIVLQQKTEKTELKVILQDAILPYREMHKVYEDDNDTNHGSYKDMNNFLLQPEVRDFTTMYKLCSGGKNALTTDDMKQAINLIKNENGTMQCKPMLDQNDVDVYKKAFPKCHRGEAYSGQTTTDCPYLDETLAGARRALGDRDFQDVANQGKAVRWPENYQQAQRFGKVVGKLDSEYIEGSSEVSADDLAYLRRKKRMEEREEDVDNEDVSGDDFMKDGYGLSKNNFLRIVKCAFLNKRRRKYKERNDYALEISVSENRNRIQSDDGAIQQCKFRDYVLLYSDNDTLTVTMDDNGKLTVQNAEGYDLDNVLVFLPDPTKGWIEHGTTVNFEDDDGTATCQLENKRFSIHSRASDEDIKVLLIFNKMYEFAYVLSDVDEHGSFETVLENSDAKFDRMVFSDTQWVNAEPVPKNETNVWKSKLRHWISTGNATGTFGLPALCAEAGIQRKGATRPSNKVRRDRLYADPDPNEKKKAGLCRRINGDSVEYKIRECTSDTDEKNDLYRKDDFIDNRFRLSMFTAMDVAACPAKGYRDNSVVESEIRKKDWKIIEDKNGNKSVVFKDEVTDFRKKRVMKNVVDALVDVLRGAKEICKGRGKKQVLGQDIIDHLLKTHPESYRKVFHTEEESEEEEEESEEEKEESEGEGEGEEGEEEDEEEDEEEEEEVDERQEGEEGEGEKEEEVDEGEEEDEEGEEEEEVDERAEEEFDLLRNFKTNLNRTTSLDRTGVRNDGNITGNTVSLDHVLDDQLRIDEGVSWDPNIFIEMDQTNPPNQ